MARLIEWRDGLVLWTAVLVLLVLAVLLSVLGASTWQERAGWLLIGTAVGSITLRAKRSGLTGFPQWVLVPLLANQAWIIFGDLSRGTFGWAVVVDGALIACCALVMYARSRPNMQG